MNYTYILFLILPFLSAAQLDSSHLPIVIIETNGQFIVDEPKIMADMGIIYNGPGLMNYITDSFNNYNGKIGIELRGSSSLSIYEKKQYAVETRDALGENANVKLLGLPKENDWILHAPYSDKTLIRNALAYKLAGQIMDYAPRYKFCEVIINGDYKGLYLLLEKIKRDNDRVAISKLNPDENKGDDLTGGYILKIDKFDGGINDGFTSAYPPGPGGEQEIFYQYHYPKPENITALQSTYVQESINNFEDVMYGSNYADSISGYSQFIDPATFIDYFLINEMTKNVDAYRISTYLYKDRDSIDARWKMGPVWDFNLGFGNVDFCMGPNPTDWVLDYANFCPNDFWLRPFWWTKLLQDSAFKQQTKERWVSLRQGIFSNDSLQDCINMMVDEIGLAKARNFERWPVQNEYVWPNAYVGGSYEEDLNYLTTWLWDRLAWMDREIEDFDEIPYRQANYFDPKVYPNPTDGPLTFEYYVRESHTVDIILYNGLGQCIGVLKDDTHLNGSNKMIWENSSSYTGLLFYTFYINGKEIKSGRFYCNK